MNLWAIQVERKYHSKEILSAKILDVDTMTITEMAEELLIGSILHGGIPINNLAVENGKLVLCRYDKTLGQHKLHMYFYREKRSYRNSDRLRESFVIVLRGIRGVYEFIADNPFSISKGNKGGTSASALHIFGTTGDLGERLRREAANAGIKYNWNYSLFNGIVSARAWAFKDNRRLIFAYNESIPDYHEILCNEEMINIADMREKMKCEYCNIEMDRDKFGINVIAVTVYKFEEDDIAIPEGIQRFKKSYGGAYSVELPKTLLEIDRCAFMKDNDLLQLTFKAPINYIPKQMCAGSNLQILDYPKKCTIYRVEEAAFFNCEDLNIVYNIDTMLIDKSAFRGSGIKGLDICGCEIISDRAFKDCNKLKLVRVAGIREIGSHAFDNCTNLESVVLEGDGKNKILEIKNNAFENCKRLKSIIIDGRVIVRENAFKGCKSLKRIVISSQVSIDSSGLPKDAKIIHK